MHIHLKDLEFFAYHGLYPEERQHGNTFIVNVHVGANINGPHPVRDLSETINYEQVFSLVQSRMEEPTLLLETIAGELVHGILERFPLAMFAEVSIEKKNPPIPGMKGSVVVVASSGREMQEA